MHLLRRSLAVVVLTLLVGSASAPGARAGGANARLLAPARAGAPYVVEAENCGQPATFAVTAVAEGRVAGVRKSIPLRLEAGDAPGRWRLARQWPAEGRWVVRLVPQHRAAAISVVSLDPEGRPTGTTMVWSGDGRREADRALRAD